MSSITLPKGSLVTIVGDATYELTEHNRSPLNIAPNEIRNDIRTADGTQRRYYIASKRTFSLTWNMLPSLDSQVVDGKAAQKSMKTMYENNKGVVSFSWKEVNNSNHQVTKTATVFIDTYSEELLKRWSSFYYNVTLVLVEQ